jgi:hypothetical protein
MPACQNCISRKTILTRSTTFFFSFLFRKELQAVQQPVLLQQAQAQAQVLLQQVQAQVQVPVLVLVLVLVQVPELAQRQEPVQQH